MPPAMLMPRPPVCRTIVSVSWKEQTHVSGEGREGRAARGPSRGQGGPSPLQ